MQIDIQTRGLTLTEALRGYVERRLNLTLNSFSDRIERVAVMLEDVKGSRWGLEKRSQIRVIGAHLPPLVVEDTAAYLYMAIDRTADRARHTLTTKLAREGNWRVPVARTLSHRTLQE